MNAPQLFIDDWSIICNLVKLRKLVSVLAPLDLAARHPRGEVNPGWHKRAFLAAGSRAETAMASAASAGTSSNNPGATFCLNALNTEGGGGRGAAEKLFCN